MKKLSEDELILYKTIQQAGDNGIGIGELKGKTGKNHKLLKHLLTNMKKQKFIKQATTAFGKKEDLYLIFEAIPSAEIFGASHSSD